MENKQKTIKPKKKRVKRAVTNAYYATVYKGRRLVRKYYSGEPLLGYVEN